MHSKIMVVDNETLVLGSATLEPCAMNFHYEQDVVVTSPKVRKHAEVLRRWGETVGRCTESKGDWFTTIANGVEDLNYGICQSL